MTSKRILDRRIQALAEIEEIMGSMKALSLMETRKLSSILQNQERVIDGIETVARDFCAFHPEFAKPQHAVFQTWIVIGSDRGFCGDFNEFLVAEIERRARSQNHSRPNVIVVGRKLNDALHERIRPTANLDGPSVVEDVPRVLESLVSLTNGLMNSPDPVAFYLFYHGDELGTLRVKTLLPPFLELQETPPVPTTPPLLNQSPDRFYSELVDHYVFALLYDAFYVSMMAEHQRRVRHLDGAVRYLGDRVAEIVRRRNVLRQEEITEEIELIMLSAQSTRLPLDKSFGR